MKRNENMMNKLDLVRAISKRIDGLNQKEITIVLDETIETILDSLKAGREIYLYGFGKFGISNRKEIVKKVPTGQEVVIPAHKEPTFKFFKTAKVDF